MSASTTRDFARPFCGLVIVISALTIAASAHATQPPDCTFELELIPRDGSVIEVENPWITRTGDVHWGGYEPFGDLSAPGYDGELVYDHWEARGHEGYRLVDAEPGLYEWDFDDYPAVTQTYSFTIAGGAVEDGTPPVWEDGEVTVQQELTEVGSTQEWGYTYRSWIVEFPRATDDLTSLTNMRYLIETTAVDGQYAEFEGAVVATPQLSWSDGTRVVVVLGGTFESCRHPLPLRDQFDEEIEMELSVRAIDLGGNLSENAVSTVLTVEPNPARMNDGSGDGDGTGDDGDDAGSGGCQSTGGLPTEPVFLVLFFAFFVVARTQKSAALG